MIDLSRIFTPRACFVKVSGSTSSHTFLIRRFKASNVLGLLFCNFSFMYPQTCSAGLRSGELAGHCPLGPLAMKLGTFALSHSFVAFALWGEAPSCWKVQPILCAPKIVSK